MGVNGEFYVPGASPATKEQPVSIAQEAGWATEPVLTFWREGEYRAVAAI
jgi:hypothetical protein